MAICADQSQIVYERLCNLIFFQLAQRDLVMSFNEVPSAVSIQFLKIETASLARQIAVIGPCMPFLSLSNNSRRSFPPFMEPFDTPPFRECAVLIKTDDCTQILRCFANFSDAQNVGQEFVRRDCGRRKRNVNPNGPIHLDESPHALFISIVF